MDNISNTGALTEASLETSAGHGQVRYDTLTPTGSGAVSLYDYFGSHVGLSPVDAENTVYIRLGDSGDRLNLSDVSNPGFSSVTEDTAVSNTFTVEQNGQRIDIDLTQTISDIIEEETRVGGQLEKTYTFTNPTDQEISLELLQFIDFDLLPSATFADDGGGRVVVDGEEWVFQTDEAVDLESTPEVFTIRMQGGEEINGAFELDIFKDTVPRLANGTTLSDGVRGDGDRNGVIDSGEGADIGSAQGRGLTLAAGASQTITVITAYGRIPLIEEDTSSTGTGTGTNTDTGTGTSTGTGTISPLPEGEGIDITNIGDAESLRINIDNVNIEDISEILVFRVDSDGTRTQIESFYLLPDGELSAQYTHPDLNIITDLFESGERLEFELAGSGVSSTARTTFLESGGITLNFDNGTQLSAFLENEPTTHNSLVDDATFIDLTGLEGDTATINFSVFREADLDSTLHLYQADTEDGGIIDGVTGGTIRVGDDGYEAAVYARQLDFSLSAEDGEFAEDSVTVDLNSGSYLGMFITVDHGNGEEADIVFSHSGMNTDGQDHAKLLGNNAFSFEDTVNLGDGDFDDLVAKYEFA